MKIETNNKVQILDTLAKPDNTKATKDQKARGKDSGNVTDKVEISGAKAEVERLKAQTKAIPPTRQEKIDAIKESIENKTYNVKGELVAKSLLKAHLLDEVL